MSAPHFLPIGDMGMATRMKTEHTSRSIEVVTRTYRAPELFFGDDQYGKAVDMWSVGCIFAEMVLGKPLFEGVSDIDHLSKVFAVLGSPTENGWKVLCCFCLSRAAVCTKYRYPGS